MGTLQVEVSWLHVMLLVAELKEWLQIYSFYKSSSCINLHKLIANQLAMTMLIKTRAKCLMLIVFMPESCHHLSSMKYTTSSQMFRRTLISNHSEDIHRLDHSHYA